METDCRGGEIMKYDPSVHHRRSIRLRGYNYSQVGAYFVTVCTQNRKCLFGDIGDGEMQLNEVGRVVAAEWIKTAEIHAEIELDEWVVMPNHFNGILVIAVPLRWKNSVARCRVRFRQLFGHSNPP